MRDLLNLVEALTMAVDGHLMSMEHAAAVWKDLLVSEGLMMKKPVATLPKETETNTLKAKGGELV